MRTAKIAELKNRLSEYLRAVESGEEVVVMDRNRPIAKIVPLRSAPGIRFIAPRKPFADVRDTKYKPANWGVSSLELLLEERQDR